MTEKDRDREPDDRDARRSDENVLEAFGEENVTSGAATRGRGTTGAPLDEESARASGTGPTATPPGTGPGGNVRTPGTAVSGGPTEAGR
jgi:hypothetical protein